MTEADVERELAYIELDSEPENEGEQQLMSDEEFEEEVALAAEGRWEDLDLDRLPDSWQPMTMGELRDA